MVASNIHGLEFATAHHASRIGRAIDWNPEMAEIVGDPESTKVLGRPSLEKWRVW